MDCVFFFFNVVRTLNMRFTLNKSLSVSCSLLTGTVLFSRSLELTHLAYCNFTCNIFNSDKVFIASYTVTYLTFLSLS